MQPMGVMKKRSLQSWGLASGLGKPALAVMFSLASYADVVTDWSEVLSHAIKTAGQSPAIQARFTASVHVAIYDAVNGIVRKYQPYYVTEKAPPGARPEAAAAQAAYTVLSGLFPAQQSTFDEALAASLSDIPGIKGKSESITRGIEWGTQVGNAILEWRSQDGFSASIPGYFGGTGPGV